jgi:hypothetical protein
MQTVVALGHFLAGRDGDAHALAAVAMSELRSFPMAAGVAAASAAMSGRDAESALALNELRKKAPELRLANVSTWIPFRRPQDRDRFTEGLRRAGLPA